MKAVAYRLDALELLYSPRGKVFGASYTDVVAHLPALNLLILISLFGAILLLVNIRRRGWLLPATAIGLWLAVSIIVGGIVPSAIQRFRVVPDELNKELLELSDDFENIDIAGFSLALLFGDEQDDFLEEVAQLFGAAFGIIFLVLAFIFFIKPTKTFGFFKSTRAFKVLGRLDNIFKVIIIEDPLPNPFSVIKSDNHNTIIEPVINVNMISLNMVIF